MNGAEARCARRPKKSAEAALLDLGRAVRDPSRLRVDLPEVPDADAPFEPAEDLRQGTGLRAPGEVWVFNDLTAFWDATTPLANVQVPKTGTSIRVKSVSAQGTFMQVQVAPAR